MTFARVSIIHHSVASCSLEILHFPSEWPSTKQNVLVYVIRAKRCVAGYLASSSTRTGYPSGDICLQFAQDAVRANALPLGLPKFGLSLGALRCHQTATSRAAGKAAVLRCLLDRRHWRRHAFC